MSPIESSKLGLENFRGVFLVLGAMMTAGLVVLIIEIFVGAAQEANEKGVSTLLPFILHELS